MSSPTSIIPKAGPGPIPKTGTSTAKVPLGFDRAKAIAITNLGSETDPLYEIVSTKGTILWRGVDYKAAEAFRDQVSLDKFFHS